MQNSQMNTPSVTAFRTGVANLTDSGPQPRRGRLRQGPELSRTLPNLRAAAAQRELRILLDDLLPKDSSGRGPKCGKSGRV